MMGTGLWQVAQLSSSDRSWHIPGSGSGLLVCLAKGVEMSSAVLWQLTLLAQDGDLGIPSCASRGRVGRRGAGRW